MKPTLDFLPFRGAALHFLWSAAIFGVGICGVSGCGAKSETAAVATATPVPATVAKSKIVKPTVTKPTLAPIIIQTQKSSLPSGPQMMEDAPRPTFIPQPTPKVRPGQTIVISNGVAPTPQPRESQTIIISNAPRPQN
ncbi:hypothetical protein B1R32_11031 [Abditibacterium utsteinense]|uniref:Uncharacterized protein n=1 Tax=Abditibacterium utsteinense TaxID=1960156 RepID=A0A2S8SS13_9BACT|nr:hypothetical protein [Abditibacterium utsteinense]PQV63568.1 hypothetical protein B1R32_11031 [Abditibacterium utsteinense]